MTAKILLLIIGFGAPSNVIVPLAQQFDTAKACADVASAVDLGQFTRATVVCIDTATGQVAYLRATR